MEVVSNPTTTHFFSSSSSSYSRRIQLPPLSNCLLSFRKASSTLTSPCVLSLRKPIPITSINRALADDDDGFYPDDPMSQARKQADNLSLKGTSLFLLGTKCAMKLTVARLLADVFGYAFIDSDDVVDQAAGGSAAAKSFRASDEKGFREAETEVLKQLSAMGRLVVSAGDGAVQSSTNLVLLRDGISLWIDIPLPMTTIGKPPDNPEFLAAYEELRGGYGTADATVSLPQIAGKLNYESLDCVTPEDMVLEAVSAIGKLTRVKKMMEEAATPF
ncbi:Probable inactive shikimate kinase like 1, chloroplastic [Linum grandiflorum]